MDVLGCADEDVDRAIQHNALIQDLSYLHFDVQRGRTITRHPDDERGTTPESGSSQQRQSTTASSTSGDRSRSRSSTPIKRPLNSFMLYRRDKQTEVTSTQDNQSISKIIGTLWRNETYAVKAHYNSMADREKELHKLQHPEYKFSPQRRAAPTRRRVKPAALLQKQQEQVASGLSEYMQRSSSSSSHVQE